MSNEQTQIDAMTRRIQAAIIPAIEGESAEVVMPAMLQVVITMTMFCNRCGPKEAVESIIGTLEDTRRSGLN